MKTRTSRSCRCWRSCCYGTSSSNDGCTCWHQHPLDYWQYYQHRRGYGNHQPTFHDVHHDDHTEHGLHCRVDWPHFHHQHRRQAYRCHARGGCHCPRRSSHCPSCPTRWNRRHLRPDDQYHLHCFPSCCSDHNCPLCTPCSCSPFSFSFADSETRS